MKKVPASAVAFSETSLGMAGMQVPGLETFIVLASDEHRKAN
jgi:hypothetical protein